MITIEKFSDIFECDLLAIAKSGKIEFFNRKTFHEEDFLSLVREVMQESNEVDENIFQNQIKNENTILDKSTKGMLAKAYKDSSQSSGLRFQQLSGINTNIISKLIENFNTINLMLLLSLFGMFVLIYTSNYMNIFQIVLDKYYFNLNLSSSMKHIFYLPLLAILFHFCYLTILLIGIIETDNRIFNKVLNTLCKLSMGSYMTIPDSAIKTVFFDRIFIVIGFLVGMGDLSKDFSFLIVLTILIIYYCPWILIFMIALYLTHYLLNVIFKKFLILV